MTAPRRVLRATLAAAFALGAGLLPGACGRDRYIDPHVSCETGTCICVGGFDNCDDDLDNGCETDLQSDLGNCGSCGNDCGDGATCVGGSCLCDSGGTSCNGACVDTQTDASNCGACGASCAGGTCAAGVCQAVTIDGLDGANNVAVASGFVYATRCNVDPEPALAQEPTGGGDVVGIGMVTGCPSLLAATSDAVYWAGPLDQIVYSASLAAPATATPLAMGTIPSTYVAAGPAHLYWYSDGPTEATIERLTIATMTREKQVVKTPSGFAVDAAGVYWGDADGIHVWSVDSPMLSTDINPLVVRGLAVSGTVLFAGTASDGIEALPVAPGGVVTAILPAASALAIAADDVHVYWAEESDGSVRRANHDGSAITVLAQGEAFAAATVPFAIDGEAVYWVAAGKVRKIAK